MAKDPGRLGGTSQRPARFFTDAAEFGEWLAMHHDTETELWMGLHKKHVADRGLTWADAVPEALCWGWIDSVAQSIDDDSMRQRWTPRKRASHWSKVNLDLVDRLRAEGRMQPAGLAVWEARRREAAPYSHERGGSLELPADYTVRLADSPAAQAFWDEVTATYRRQCVNWVLTAKQQVTRDRRMAQLVECSAAGEVVPFQRYGDPPKWVQRAAAAAAAAGGQR